MSQNISLISPTYTTTQILSSSESEKPNTSGTSFAEQLVSAQTAIETPAAKAAASATNTSAMSAMGIDGTLFASMLANGDSDSIYSILSFILMYILMDQNDQSEILPDTYTPDFSTSDYSELLAQLIAQEDAAASSTQELTGQGTTTTASTTEATAASIAATAAYSKNYDAIVNSALSRLGDPYSQAKAGQGDYTDCSYLTRWCYREAGVELPRTAAAQAKWCVDNGKTISKSELQPGDLIFFSLHENDRYMNVTHVGIYAGNNMMVDASSAYGQVVYRQLFGGQVLYGRPR